MIRTDQFGTVRPLGSKRPPLLATLISALRLRAQRARLAQLDDHLLRDIGLTRAEAETEASRPLWDAPPHWHR